MGTWQLTMINYVLLLSTLLNLALARPELDSQWEEFKIRYGKQYDDSEEVTRRDIWESNYDFMEKHNAAYEAGYETFTVGENEFNDLTNEEFVSFFNGLHVNEGSEDGVVLPALKKNPEKVDWRQHGFVTPVKNQKQCGSCWAFSTTGSLEGATFNKTKKLVSLSEQNLVDCSKKDGNLGCFGGLMDNAFKYIRDNKGIDTEESYPYTAKTGKQCLFNATNVGATLTSWVDIKSGSEEALETAVAQVGPVSVAIDAGHKSFQMYKQGVYYSKECSSKKLDHGVLAVGYGTVQSQDANHPPKKYWIVKNSWGESWGMKGYINMAKDMHNICGIATKASYPVV